MAKRLKFPIIMASDSFPVGGKNLPCPMCHVGRIMEPNSFVCVSGGAIALDRKGLNTVSARLDGFLGISWHGAHSDEMGVGNLPDTFSSFELVSKSLGGQFDLYFCSTKCLRAFFNAVVDHLEERLRKFKTSNKLKRKSPANPRKQSSADRSRIRLA